MQAFRRKARALGARYVAAEAAGFEMRGDTITAVRLADGGAIGADYVVNAAGLWASRVAAWAGVELPVRARRRTVFAMDCPASLPNCPLVIDPSGLWFRPEGERRFIAGLAPDDARDHDDAPLDPEHERFEAELWPILAGRVPAFEALRVTNAWAGYYEVNTFDHNGILGFHPRVRNLVLANGFSGHGLQQSPAAGRGVAELLAHGRYSTLDLSPLGFERIERGEPLLELNVV
jgi:glycine/D-amino acid oxidase-like deaminating enzyme